MKRNGELLSNGKLLSLVIAFAMIMTMIVIPVSADTTVQPKDAAYVAPLNVNLLEEWGLNWNYDVSDGATTVKNLYGWDGSTADSNASDGKRPAKRDINMNQTSSGTYTAPAADNAGYAGGVDNSKCGTFTATAATDTFRINFVPLEPGAAYVMTVDIKLAEGTTGTVAWDINNNNNSMCKPNAINMGYDNTVSSGKYNTVKVAFKADTYTKATGYDRNHIHIGIKGLVGTYYADNWTLTKIPYMTTADYTAPTGVNLFNEWGLNWNYDVSSGASAIKNLYGWDGVTLDENSSKVHDASNNNYRPAFETKMNQSSNSDVTPVKEATGGVDNSACYSYTAAAETDKFRFTFVPLENATYVLTADIKLAEGTTGTPVWSLETGNSSLYSVNDNDKTTIIDMGYDNSVNTTEFKTIKVAFKPKENKTTGYDRNHTHMGIKGLVGTYYIDNWTLTKIAAPSISNAVVSNGNAVFTFDSDVTITKDNFNVSPATATVNVTGSGSEYTVTLSDYIHSTEYTVTTKNIEKYGLALTENKSVKILTPADANATPLNTEDLTSGHGISGNRGTLVDGTFTRDEETGTDTDSRVHATHIFVIPGTYVVSAKVRQNEADEISNATAQVVGGNSGDVSKNTSGAAIEPCINSTAIGDAISINKTDWTEITGILTVATAKGWNDDNGDLRDDDSLAQTIHAGVASTAHKFDIKDIQVRRVASLNLNGAYAAVVKADGSNANLYITGPASTVYFAAATYEGKRVIDIQFKKLTLTENKLSVEKLTKGDSYKFFIWDSNMNPLNSTFMVSEF